MKINIYFIPALFLITTNACSQSKLIEGSVKAKTTTFKVVNGTSSMMEVFNQNNSLLNTVPPKDLVRLSAAKLTNENAVTNAFLKVFKPAKLKELLPERFAIMNFYIDHYGKIRFMQFSLKKNTLITSIELEALEKQLKNDVTFVVPAGEGKTDNIWPITYLTPFAKVYEKAVIN